MSNAWAMLFLSKIIFPLFAQISAKWYGKILEQNEIDNTIQNRQQHLKHCWRDWNCYSLLKNVINHSIFNMEIFLNLEQTLGYQGLS